MFKKIGLPLDGSERAERALSAAVGIARHFQADLLLMRVQETGLITTAPVTGEIRAVAQAEAYLEQLRTRLTFPTNQAPLRPEQVQIRVGYGGSAASRLAEMSQEEGVDLIVMTTHGLGGFKHGLTGSVAAGLLQRLKVPIVLLGPAILSQPASEKDEFSRCPARPLDRYLW